MVPFQMCLAGFCPSCPGTNLFNFIFSLWIVSSIHLADAAVSADITDISLGVQVLIGIISYCKQFLAPAWIHCVGKLNCYWSYNSNQSLCGQQCSQANQWRQCWTSDSWKALSVGCKGKHSFSSTSWTKTNCRMITAAFVPVLCLRQSPKTLQWERRLAISDMLTFISIPLSYEQVVDSNPFQMLCSYAVIASIE